MIIILIRTIILYAVVLISIRIMGKSELSKMSPFQLVVVFMIAELASLPIESPTMSLINGVAAIASLVFLQVLISLLSIKSEKLKNFFNGKPSILIEKGQINEKKLKALRISINDLMEQLRLGNAPCLSDVEYAIMESNGQLSVIPKADKKPLTPSQMSITVEDEMLPLIVISDGFIYRQNLKTLGWDEEYLITQLESINIDDPKKVFLAFTDESCQLHTYVTNPMSQKAMEVSICEPS